MRATTERKTADGRSKAAKQILQWIAALTAGFLVINAFVFFFERPVGWYDTKNGVSLSLRRPGSILVHGTEGYSVSIVDKNGFMNSGTELADAYLLVMGSSHTQGKEVSQKDRYSEIVSASIRKDENRMAAYNIASDGHFLPSLIRYFSAALSQYPDAKAYIFEIGSVTYSPQELEKSCLQVTFEDSDTAAYFERLTAGKKLIQTVKEAAPLLSLMKTQAETILEKYAKSSAAQPIDPETYSTALDHALALIRSETDKPIVFVRHPKLRLETDGSMQLEEEPLWAVFQEACGRNGIDVIDCGDAFLENYRQNQTVPYGFSNTRPLSGHLNTVGHRIVADKLIEYVTERNVMGT